MQTTARSVRRGIAISLVLHAVFGAIGSVTIEPAKRVELVDIELAPPAPAVQALPAEQKRTPEEQLAQQHQTPQQADEAAQQPQQPQQPGEGGAGRDAGVDAPIDADVDAPLDAPLDAPVDAPPRRRKPRPDAAPSIDAGEPMLAELDDAGVSESESDATTVAIEDGGGLPAPDDAGATEVATGSGSGSGSGSGAGAGAGVGSGVGSGVGPGSLADEAGAGSGSAKPGLADEVAVDGAATTAGTAANLLAYFPKGHKVTVLVRFDRLRGTDWLPLTERLFQPMPDYRRLFGATDAKIGEKLETLVISTPEPASAIATTLVARTKLARPALRTFLATAGPVVWSPAKGGLVGKRGGPNLFPGDKRVFLSPFRGWFLLAHPTDLPNLLAPSTGNLDAIESTTKLPAWVHSIRTIEAESGTDAKGPALVLTMDLGGKRRSLGAGGDFGLGVKSFPMPQRITVAAEVVKQGWIVHGNLRFATAAEANELVKTATAVKQRIADSTALQFAVGKPIARIVANLSFAKAGERVSYATSVSIGDMQAVMAVATQLLDDHFATK